MGSVFVAFDDNILNKIAILYLRLVISTKMQSTDTEFKKIDAFVNLKGLNVLEIGCGDGRLSAFLAQKAGNLTAIDIDEAGLEEARRTVKGVDFRIGSGECLEFPEDSFDLVFFGFSLHHQKGSAALSEAGRVLVPEGKILIIEPTVESEYTKLVSVFQKEEPDLLRQAARAIYAAGMTVHRKETFVVEHYFDNEETFLNHYISSYGSGSTDESCHHQLLQVIGEKRFESPIIVEDQCSITLTRINRKY